MSTKPVEPLQPAEAASAHLERALLQEFLKEQGYSLLELRTLPAERAEELMKAASQFASLKLEEVEARARFIEALHQDLAALKP